jgi:uncharacterized protein (TIGR00730 family)
MGDRDPPLNPLGVSEPHGRNLRDEDGLVAGRTAAYPIPARRIAFPPGCAAGRYPRRSPLTPTPPARHEKGLPEWGGMRTGGSNSLNESQGMTKIRSVAVFCGSRPGRSPLYQAAAAELGQGLGRAGLALVFGGGRIGLMGAMADAVLAAGGRVVGVIPDFLQQWEVAHQGVNELIVTDTMHTRKQRMFELADAFVSFPGGFGTFDETFEVLTWRQLRLHDKPILICDVAGSATALVGLLENAIEEGFAPPDGRKLYEVVHGVPALLARLEELQAPPEDAALVQGVA